MLYYDDKVRMCLAFEIFFLFKEKKYREIKIFCKQNDWNFYDGEK